MTLCHYRKQQRSGMTVTRFDPNDSKYLTAVTITMNSNCKISFNKKRTFFKTFDILVFGRISRNPFIALSYDLKIL